jgi:hypothetical protein
MNRTSANPAFAQHRRIIIGVSITALALLWAIRTAHGDKRLMTAPHAVIGSVIAWGIATPARDLEQTLHRPARAVFWVGVLSLAAGVAVIKHTTRMRILHHGTRLAA